MRINGGIIGLPNQANALVASGVWGWDEKFLLRTKDSFPNIIVGYDVHQFNLNNFEETLPITTCSDVYFKPDGYSVFVSSSSSVNAVHRYDLLSPWDIRTTYNYKIWYPPNPPSITSIQSLFFSSDGTKLYILDDGATDFVHQYPLSTPWDPSTADIANSVSYSLTNETSSFGLAFSSDGTIMYTVGGSTDTVREYLLSSPWNLASTVTIGGTYHVTVQAANPTGVRFNSSGTKMLISDSSSYKIFQYDLATAWQANTASYTTSAYDAAILLTSGGPTGLDWINNDSKLVVAGSSAIYALEVQNVEQITSAVYNNLSALSLGQQEPNPTGIAFKLDGTSMYVVGTGTDRVYQYTLSTPWDVTTASNTSFSFAVNSQDTTPASLAFSSDGTKMYLLGGSGDDLNQYSLSNAWNVSSATFDSVTLVFSGDPVLETTPTGVTFKDDGTKLYVTGSVRDNVYQYSMSTPWDISSATYDSVFFYFGSQDTSPAGIVFTDNGSKLYLAGGTGDDIMEYNLSESWNVASASHSGATFKPVFKTTTSGFSDIAISSDGSLVYALESARRAVFPFSLRTPNNLSTAITNSYSYFAGGLETNPAGLALHPEGTSLYVVGSTTDRVYQFDMSTPFSLATLSYNGSNVSVLGQDSSPSALTFKPDGTTMYVVGDSANRVSQYTLASPWNVSSASFASINYLINQDVNPFGVSFKPDGSKMYISGRETGNVYQYTLSTPWNVSSATYDNVVLSTNTSSSLADVAFKPNGKELYVSITGTNVNNVRQYSLSSAWDISSARTVKEFYTSSIDSTGFRSISISPDGKKLYGLSPTTDNIYEININ